MIAWLNTTTGLFVSVCALLTFLWAGWKWARPRLDEAKADRIAQRDAIIGRPAVKDSITGKELAPALPGIGVRQANMEQQLTVLTEAVSKMAESNRRLDDLDERVTSLEKINGIDKIAARVEAVELFRTIDSAINADPPPPPQRRSPPPVDQ